MITTTHAILNTALLGRKKHPERNWPLILGSIFPDLPMILFGLWMVLTHGSFRSTGKTGFINEYHFRQLWVDWGHSIPLALAGLLLCLLLKNNWGLYFFSAMGLHDLEDLPLHSESPHRHFLPFSNWQFHSPISYVDPKYHAAIVAPLEWLIVLVCIGILWRRGISPWVQALLLFIGVFQGLWLLFYYGGIRW
jgi:hypothetical protein